MALMVELDGGDHVEQVVAQVQHLQQLQIAQPLEGQVSGWKIKS